MTDKHEFLGGLPLFEGLSEQGLALIAGITTEYEFDKGAVIAYQRDVAGSLYMVKEGRLFARALDNNGIARDSRSYLPGDYFDDIWLFVGGIQPATIKGAEMGRLLVIEGPAFVRLLREYPALIDALAPREEDGVHKGLSDAAWVEAQKLKVRRRERTTTAALLPEERLEFFARRSHWVLLGRILAPILLMLLAAAILIIMPTQTGLERLAKVALPAVFGLLSLIWFTLRLIDWRADYFIITNRHLTHHEFELRHFRIQLIKIPIGQVQTVEILKPTFLANLFNIGSAKVTTAAVTGSVVFSHIDNPMAVKEILDRLTGQYRSLQSAQTQAVMRQTIEKHFGLRPEMTVTDAAAPSASRRGRRAEGFSSTLSRRFGWRVEEGNVITYRKSIFILIKQVGLPMLAFILLAVLLGLGLYLEITLWVLALLIGAASLVNLGWFIWQFENWRNDIFQVTDRFVVDIDRLPFGFGESRKQAPISNIQNVDASRPGFLATLFNYGFVSIDTAGAKSDIVFDYVPNPEIVQSDIFLRLDEHRRQTQIREGSSRREEYALLLDVYRQAMEQRRIPQRTPSGSSEEEEQDV